MVRHAAQPPRTVPTLETRRFVMRALPRFDAAALLPLRDQVVLHQQQIASLQDSVTQVTLQLAKQQSDSSALVT